MMKLIAALIGLTCAYMVGATTLETVIGVDLQSLEKIEDRADTVSEDKLKDNELFSLGDKLSDEFAKSGDSEDVFSVRSSDAHETVYKYNDFEDDAHKHDLEKNSNFGIGLKSIDNVAKSDEVISSKGTNLDKSHASRANLGLDSSVYDKENIGSQHDSENAKLHKKGFGVESLLSHGFDSLFDKGTGFEFETSHKAHPRYNEPHILHPGDNVVAFPGDGIVVHPGDDIVRTDGDVVVNHGEIIDDFIPVERLAAISESGAVGLEHIEAPPKTDSRYTEPHIVHSGDDIIVLPGDEIVGNPVEDIIVRTDEDVVVNPGEIIGNAVPVKSGIVGLEHIETLSNFDAPQGLLKGRLADILQHRRVGAIGW